MERGMAMGNYRTWCGAVGCGLLLSTLGLFVGLPRVSAEVRREGTWPVDEPISLSVQGATRAEAVEQVAEAAGWDLVAEDLGEARVHVRVDKQPPVEVLRLLLANDDYVVRRTGNLVAISKAADETGAPAPVAAREDSARDDSEGDGWASASKGGKGEDRFVTGDFRLAPDDVVADLVVAGGDALLEGVVTGDVAVFGGSAKLASGAHLEGDLVTFGGEVELAEGARVDGELGALGGSIRGADGTSVKGFEGVAWDGDGFEGRAESESVWALVASALTKTALLWLFGAMLLAIAAPRMRVLEGEVTGRPFRAGALGLASLGAAVVLLIALCITLIGIPLAFVGAMVLLVGVYGGFCAVLLTVGALLLRTRTDNPYAHLAAGCGLYLLLGDIPGLGGLVTALIVLTGVGALVATHAGRAVRGTHLAA